MSSESTDANQEISTIKLPEHLATLEGSGSDSESTPNASSAVELTDKLATPEKKTNSATDTNDCIGLEPPDSVIRLEIIKNGVDGADDCASSYKPVSPIGAPEVSTVGLSVGHVALEASLLGTACDTVKPSTPNLADELDQPDNKLANNKLPAIELADSPAEPEHYVNKTDKVDSAAATAQPPGSDVKAEINENQDKPPTNSPPTDELKSVKVFQEDSSIEPDDRAIVEGSSGDGKVDERSSTTWIVDYLSTMGTSTAGAPYTASGDKRDISTDEHVFPIAIQQTSPNLAESPPTPETIDNDTHHVEVDNPTARCEDHFSAITEIGEDSTGELNNVPSSVQPIPGFVTPGPTKKWPDDGDNEFSTGNSANNFVIPEAVEHKKTPHDTKGEPFIIGSTDVFVSENMAINSSDGYSTDRAYLDTIDDDDDDSRLPPASIGPLTPNSTISSHHVEDFLEFEGELEEGEVSEETITVFHDAVRFNVKHPLTNKWTLWYTKPSYGKPGESWSDLLKEIQTFDSVEGFWAIYNNVPPPSTIPNKSDYQLFKLGIRPEWEDPSNRRGGRFSYMVRERRDIDAQWLDVLLATIGETMEPEGVSEVQGVVANIRKGFTRISCWTRTTGAGWGDMDNLIALGRHFKEVLELKNGEIVDFSGHDESASSGSTRARVSFSI